VLDVSAFAAIQTARNSDRTGAIAQKSTASDRQGVIALSSLNLADAEETLIDAALRSSNDNRTHAAALLGIGVRTLRKKLNAPERLGATEDVSQLSD
jgi:DNA-binding protein Fis